MSMQSTGTFNVAMSEQNADSKQTALRNHVMWRHIVTPLITLCSEQQTILQQSTAHRPFTPLMNCFAIAESLATDLFLHGLWPVDVSAAAALTMSSFVKPQNGFGLVNGMFVNHRIYRFSVTFTNVTVVNIVRETFFDTVTFKSLLLPYMEATIIRIL
jgi:hypothetical protein